MQGLIGALISSLSFSGANVVIKKSLEDLSIPKTLFMTDVSGAVFMFIFMMLSGGPESLSPQLIVGSIFLALAEIALYLSLFKAFSLSLVAAATAIIQTYPVVTSIFAFLFLGEAIVGLDIVFILLIVSGGILASIDWRKVRKDGFDSNDFIKGLPWIILTIFINAAYFPTLGVFTGAGDLPTRLLWIKIFSTIFVFIFFKIIRGQELIPKRERVVQTSLLGLLEVIGWAGISWAIAAKTASSAVTISFLNAGSVFTAFLAFIFLKEKLTKLQYLGILIVVVCITFFSIY